MKRQQGMSSLDFKNFEEMRKDEGVKALVYRATSRYRPYLDEDVIDSEIDYTLLRVWDLHNEERGMVSTYLYSSLHNNLNRILRKKFNSPVNTRVNEDIFPDLYSLGESAFEVLDSLNNKEKEIVMGRTVYGETFKSIGKRMNLTPTNVSKIYKKSLRKLKKDCFG